MSEQIVSELWKISPLVGIIGSMLIVALVTLSGVVVILYRAKCKIEDNERKTLGRALTAFDQVGEGMKAASRDRERTIQFEEHMRATHIALKEGQDLVKELINNGHDALKDWIVVVNKKK